MGFCCTYTSEEMACCSKGLVLLRELLRIFLLEAILSALEGRI